MNETATVMAKICDRMTGDPILQNPDRSGMHTLNERNEEDGGLIQTVSLRKGNRAPPASHVPLAGT